MVQPGDSTGQYRGLIHRNDADLRAWLAKRPREAALEPELPIIDPHHHFWDAPHRGRYFLPELLEDIGGGHNIVATVFLECQAMYRKDGPREMAPVGEVEFVNGIAAMSASGNYGPCRVAEAIIGHADLHAGRAGARRAGGARSRSAAAGSAASAMACPGTAIDGDRQIRFARRCRRIWCATRRSARDSRSLRSSG